MAMFPNATHGYMPFVSGKNKRSKLHVNGGKLHKSDTRKQASLSVSQKMYQITLKDKKGNTYKCIVKTDGTKSLPELCQSKLNVSTPHKSMPDITAVNSPSKQRQVLAEKLDALNSISEGGESFSTSLDLRNCGKKEGLLSAFIRFIKEKTGKNEKAAQKESKSKSNGKSKRKPRDLTQRKRQRTVSAMSNLDPIEESPNEHEYEDFSDDNDSYTHYSSSCPSDCDSVSSHISCNIEPVLSASTS